ncbi:MAG: SEC-C domain-containing protein [Anaerolineales bacterium]|nr:SEC-C domain-containing protein [Anaerolineales bacterium]
MFRNFLKAIAGDPNKKDIQRYSTVVAEINALEPEFRRLTDAELRAKTDEFRAHLAQAARAAGDDPAALQKAEQAALDDLLPEAFAATREAAMRAIGQRHYDVQLIGGMALHSGKIAEMRTGEGKTLVGTLPVYLNALLGRGVHIVTVNDYLARRDARWMFPIYNLLGLSVGVLQEAARTENGRKAFVVDPGKESAQEDAHQMRLVERGEAYAADIIYGTNHEFGFDYLRDNMALSLNARVQRERYFAIVDEVDNILIDEARTPLIISGPAQEEPALYLRLAQVVRQLKPDDYEVSDRDRTIALTEIGEAHVEKLLGEPLRDPDRPEDITPEQARILGHLEQALRAEFLFKRNKDYLVQAGKIVIVDEFTGRQMAGRRWSDGLHQAVEAKEGVPVQQESVTYATITLQNYFRLYQKLAGMTGTALTEAEEFDKIYKLAVVAIPTNLEYTAHKPESGLTEVEYKEDGQKFIYFGQKTDPKTAVYWRRKDYPDMVYRTEEAKLRALTIQIVERHVVGQPLLVGTTSVELSERVSDRLRPEPLQRLMQVLLIRDAWFEKNNKEEDGMQVAELKPLNDDLYSLSRQDLAKQLKDLGLSSNPVGPDNLTRLIRVLALPAGSEAALTQVLQAGIPHDVLNAKKHDEESRIIAGAGALGAVTIATNMAGRGVDIKLGGELAEEIVTAVNRVLRKAGHADPYNLNSEARRAELLRVPRDNWGLYQGEAEHFLQAMDDAARVKQLGGLHVIGSERHESRRIDNQLRGRAARQGDPGSSQFYLSLEDELMRRFGGQGVSDMMQRLKIDDGVPIQAGLVNRTIEQAQTRVEGYNFDVRKHLLEYDDVLNTQRNRIYAQRDLVFTKDDLTDDFLEMLTTEVARRVDLAEHDAEGKWRLFAWLEEAQPSLPVSPDKIYPSYVLEILLRDLEDEPDKPAALLALARTALETERAHLLEAVGQQADQAAERLAAQVKQKKTEAELALEGLENEAEEKGAQVEARAAYRLVSEVLGLNLTPDAAALKDFDYRAFKKEIPEWAEAATASRVRVGLVGAIERRLGAQLNIQREAKPDEIWDDVRQQLLDAAEATHTAKAARSLADIERELGQHLPAAPTRDQLTRALVSMAIGTVTGFDQKTHRKVAVRTQRLNYFFAAAQMVEDWSVADLKADVLEHLHGALAALREMWGEAEFRRLAVARPTELPPFLRQALAAAPDVSAALSVAPTLGELNGEPRAQALGLVGRGTLTQLFRQIMVQVIGGLWVDYLTSVEALRTSVGLEAYAQRDPLVAYKGRAFEMFQQLLVNMRAGVVSRAFTYRPRADAPAPAQARATPAPANAPVAANGGPARPAVGALRPSSARVVEMPASAPAAPPAAPPEARTLGRNDPCWCGSGKKYKDCHWGRDHAAPAPASDGGEGAAAEASGGGKRRRRKR